MTDANLMLAVRRALRLFRQANAGTRSQFLSFETTAGYVASDDSQYIPGLSRTARRHAHTYHAGRAFDLACRLLSRVDDYERRERLDSRLLRPHNPMMCDITERVVPLAFITEDSDVYNCDDEALTLWQLAVDREPLPPHHTIESGYTWRHGGLSRADLYGSRGDFYMRQGERYTQSAYDNSYECTSCGHIGNNEDSYSPDDGDGPFCSCCHDERERDDDNGRSSLSCYSSVPSSRHWFKSAAKEPTNDRTPFLGVELEVYARGVADSDVSLSALVADIHAATRNEVICKSDGSLDDSYGFEICSAPATLKYHQQAMWRRFFEGPATHLRGWKRRECGMHVHISRKAFAGNFHIARFVRFITAENNYAFVSRIAGRDWRNNDYCSGRPSAIKGALKGQQEERYSAVNRYSSQPTLEVRIFQSNVAPLGFYKNLEFVHAAFVFTADAGLSDEALSTDAFCRFVRANVATYRALAAWLQRQNLIAGIKPVSPRLTDATYASRTFGAIDAT